MPEEQQRQDEVYEQRRLAEMRLRLRTQEVEHRQRRDGLKEELHQEAATTDRAAYLMFVEERAAGDQRRRSNRRASERVAGDRPRPQNRVASR
jgi:hypothetical protein